MRDSIDKIARDVCEAVCEYRKQVGFDCSSMGCSGCRFEVSTMRGEIMRRIDDITSEFFMPYPMGKDGELIKPGNTYYGEDGKAWAIKAIGLVYSYGVDAKNPGVSKRLRHEWLTKDAPDSWARIEADSRLATPDYANKHNIVGLNIPDLVRDDLLRRCRKLIKETVL